MMFLATSFDNENSPSDADVSNSEAWTSLKQINGKYQISETG
jgi:hypothetical protein